MSAALEGEKAVIKISGYIGGWRNNSFDLEYEVQEYLSQGIVNVDVHMNSIGGSIVEANQIANLIKKFTGTKAGYIGAICASACTEIACACDTVSMARNGQYMVHRPWVEAEGNEDDLQGSLNALRSFQSTLLQTYVSKTGQAQEELDAKWKIDWWMNAEAAKAEGFVDEVEGEAVIDPDDAATILDMYKNVPDYLKVAASVRKPNPAPKPESQNQDDKISDMDRKEIIAQLGLPATASDTDIKNAIASMKAKAGKVDDLERQFKDQKEADAKAKAEKLIAQAKADKKITDEAVAESWVKAAINDYEGTEKMIKAMPGVKKLETTSSGAAAESTDRSKWTYENWVEKDGETLLAMADPSHEKHDTFKALFKDRYGAEYTGK